MLELPGKLGKYELLEYLGGGMSHVYRGRDPVIDRAVVVKILTPEACADVEAKARFLQEVRLAGNIQHENIVNVFDYGDHEGRPYIVMEYLEGQDLRQAIRGGVLSSLEQRIAVAGAVAAALEHIHQRGIVHRDIKPENIHLSNTGKVKLMDFGIAKTADLSLTKTGMAMGTPYYMAPEQVMGGKVAPAADIYAYGLVLFELFTGRRGVTGDTMEAVFYQILNVPVDVAALESAGVPAPLRDLIVHCTAKKAEDRPESFAMVRAALAQRGPAVVERTQSLPLPPPTAPIPHAPAPQATEGAPRVAFKPLMLGIAAGLIAVAGVVAWFALGRGPKVVEVPGMVFYPAGTFLAGADKKPTELGAFYLDETEVSRGKFCEVMGCAADAGSADLPVVDISVDQAREFARKSGKRLPTGAEWERAARGTNGAFFPWGDQLETMRANVADHPAPAHRLMPVGSFGAFPTHHLIGNAWEMVEGKLTPSQQALDQFATLLEPAPGAGEPWIAIRGGSFNERLSPGLAYDTASIPERFHSPLIGFRCAKDGAVR